TLPMTLSTRLLLLFCFPAPTISVIHTLSLHDALPICEYSNQRRAPFWLKSYVIADLEIQHLRVRAHLVEKPQAFHDPVVQINQLDRKSTRLNSSHDQISYAVFCLKKKIIFLNLQCVAS